MATEYGEILRRRRVRLDLTIRELAVTLDISEATLSRYERGRSRPTSRERFAGLHSDACRTLSARADVATEYGEILRRRRARLT